MLARSVEDVARRRRPARIAGERAVERLLDEPVPLAQLVRTARRRRTCASCRRSRPTRCRAARGRSRSARRRGSARSPCRGRSRDCGAVRDDELVGACAVLDERLARSRPSRRSEVSGSPSTPSAGPVRPRRAGAGRARRPFRPRRRAGRGGSPRARPRSSTRRRSSKNVAVARQLDAARAQAVGEHQREEAGTTALVTPSSRTRAHGDLVDDLARGRCPRAISSSSPNSSSGCSSKPPSSRARISSEPTTTCRTPFARRRGTGRGRRSAPRAGARASGPCRRRSGRLACGVTARSSDALDAAARIDSSVDDAIAARSSSSTQYDDELRRELPRRRGDLRRPPAPRARHRRDGRRPRRARRELMDRYGISRAFMFCLDEPDRHPAFRAANDRTLASRPARDGRLIPFVRLDLNEEPIEEATRCLDAGARGIKLHPRAQGFLLNDERLGAGLRARRRAERADPDPRRPRPAADRGRARALVERYPGGAADHRPRRDRRPRRARAALRRARRRPLRHLHVEPGRPARLLPPGARRSRSSTPPTTPTASSPPRSSSRSAPPASPASPTTQVRGMLAATRRGSPTARRRSSRPRRRAPRRSRSRSSSPGSTSTCRWRPRSSGRARRTRSACSGWRSTPARSGTAPRTTPRADPRAARDGTRPLARAAGGRGRKDDAGDPADVPPPPPRRHPLGDAGA